MATYAQPKEYTFLKIVGRLLIAAAIAFIFFSWHFLIPDVQVKYWHLLWDENLPTIVAPCVVFAYADEICFKLGLYDLAPVVDPALTPAAEEV